MVSIGDYKIGLFCEHKDMYKELEDGGYIIKNENEYARTGTSNVVLLLDKDDTIVSIDDIPTNYAFEEVVGEEFVAFLQWKEMYAFVINTDSSLIYLKDEDYVQTTPQGELKYIKVDSEDFVLEAFIDTNDTTKINALEEGDMLLVYSTVTPNIVKKEDKLNFYFFIAGAKILKSNLD